MLRLTGWLRATKSHTLLVTTDHCSLQFVQILWETIETSHVASCSQFPHLKLPVLAAQASSNPQCVLARLAAASASLP